MRISRTEAWLLVLGAFGISALAGLVLFLIGMAISWFVLVIGVTVEVITFVGGVGYFAKAVRTVPESERWVIEVFGSFAHVARPGLNFLLPGIEEVRSRQTTKEQFVSVDTKNTITLDNANVSFLAQLYFGLDPDDKQAPSYKATYAFENEGKDPEEAIKNLAEAALRSIAGTQELSFLKNNQKELNELVLEMIREKMLSWGFVVKNHIIKELIPSKEVGEAIERKLIAEATGAATVATATANKLATIEVAEGDKQKRIKAAEANEQEQVLDARGEAARLKQIAKVLGGEQQAMAFHLGEKAVESLGKAGSTIVGLPSGDLLGGIAASVMAALTPKK